MNPTPRVIRAASLGALLAATASLASAAPKCEGTTWGSSEVEVFDTGSNTCVKKPAPPYYWDFYATSGFGHADWRKPGAKDYILGLNKYEHEMAASEEPYRAYQSASQEAAAAKEKAEGAADAKSKKTILTEATKKFKTAKDAVTEAFGEGSPEAKEAASVAKALRDARDDAMDAADKATAAKMQKKLQESRNTGSLKSAEAVGQRVKSGGSLQSKAGALNSMFDASAAGKDAGNAAKPGTRGAEVGAGPSGGGQLRNTSDAQSTYSKDVKAPPPPKAQEASAGLAVAGGVASTGGGGGLLGSGTLPVVGTVTGGAIVGGAAIGLLAIGTGLWAKQKYDNYEGDKALAQANSDEKAAKDYVSYEKANEGTGLTKDQIRANWVNESTDSGMSPHDKQSFINKLKD